MSEEHPLTPPPYRPPGSTSANPDVTPADNIWDDQSPSPTGPDVTPADPNLPEPQPAHERLSSKELAEKAQVIGRVVLDKTGVVVTKVREHLVKGYAKARVGYSKVRERMAEKALAGAVDSHYDAISSEIRIGEIRDAAIRTLDTSVAVPERYGGAEYSQELSKGDFRARIKDLRMERKIDDHADAARKNKRLRNNTGLVRSPIRSKVQRTKNRLVISKDLVTGKSSASESLTRLSTNRGSTVDIETTKVKRSGRAESSEKKKAIKYANKIERRAERRSVRGMHKIVRKERQLDKRTKKRQKSEEKLRELG
jgi:hypothetical protein